MTPYGFFALISSRLPSSVSYEISSSPGCRSLWKLLSREVILSWLGLGLGLVLGLGFGLGFGFGLGLGLRLTLNPNLLHVGRDDGRLELVAQPLLHLMVSVGEIGECAQVRWRHGSPCLASKQRGLSPHWPTGQARASGLWSGGWPRGLYGTPRRGTSAFQLRTSDVGEMTIALTQSGLFTGLCRSSVQSTEMVCSVLPAHGCSAIRCSAPW